MATRPPITSDRQILGLKAEAKPFEVSVAGVRGLAMRIFPTGTKNFEFRYVALNGTRRRYPLGDYPARSLADARKKAAELHVAVLNGEDPAASRAADKAAARTGDTLTELAEAYFTAATKGLHGGRGRPKRPLTLAVERNRFERHIAPRLGKRRFKEIKRADVRTFMRELAVEGALAADTIASVGGTLSTLFAFAVHEEQIDANPATGLTRPLALNVRERTFNDTAIAALWSALESVSASPAPARLGQKKRAAAAPRSAPRASADSAIALGLRFAMLTLARRNDVAMARWEEIDLEQKIWVIPATRFKSRRAHVVPLSSEAVAVLHLARALPGGQGEVVFPSPLQLASLPDRPARAITPNALTRALTRTLADLNLPHGSPHDFRRAGATTLTGERYGFRRFVVGKVLGHTVDDGAAVTGVYDRNDYLPDKRAALAAWSKHVVALASGTPLPSNVTPFAAQREAS